MSVPLVPDRETLPAEEQRLWSAAMHGLLLAGVFGYVTAVLGVALAYIKRGDLRGTAYETHVTYAIRTFWIGLIGGVALTVVMFLLTLTIVLAPLAWLLGVVGLIWWLYRCGRGLLLAMERRPVANPLSWL